MGSKKAALANRAWNLLRLALIWARKGGVFKRSLTRELRRNYFKSLRPTARNSIHYGEREFSFDETPMFNFKMHRRGSMRFRYLPHIPCINPPLVDFDVDGEGLCNGEDENKISLRRSSVEEAYGYSGVNDDEEGSRQQGEDGIDGKAEEFIARFYRQMKLQRQLSNLQYKEMLQRGTT